MGSSQEPPLKQNIQQKSSLNPFKLGCEVIIIKQWGSNLRILNKHRCTENISLNGFISVVILHSIWMNFTPFPAGGFLPDSPILRYATRHSSALHSEFCRTPCRQSSVRMQGRKLWNALPLDIKKLSLIVFKKTLKGCIIFNQTDWTIVIYKLCCASFNHAPAFYAHYWRVIY